MVLWIWEDKELASFSLLLFNKTEIGGKPNCGVLFSEASRSLCSEVWTQRGGREHRGKEWVLGDCGSYFPLISTSSFDF